jgi:hypothetical protein
MRRGAQLKLAEAQFEGATKLLLPNNPAGRMMLCSHRIRRYGTVSSGAVGT